MTRSTILTHGFTTLVLALALAAASPAGAQERAGRGLVTAVDPVGRTVTLDTVSGPRQVRVAPGAAIVGDHDRALTLIDVAPGDAVSYRLGSEHAASLRVASHFWAAPGEQ